MNKGCGVETGLGGESKCLLVTGVLVTDGIVSFPEEDGVE
jgi:hypothetical protein